MSRTKPSKQPKDNKTKGAASSERHPRKHLYIALGVGVLLALLLTLFGMGSGSAKDSGFKILRKIPHDPEAFSQGLLFHDGHFYESTGQYGHSSLRRVDPTTGNILQQLDLDRNYFGEGLAFNKGILVQLTWQSKKAFVYNSESFEKLNEYTYDTEGWGLTHDGKHYIMSDGSHRLYFRDDAFKTQRVIEVKDKGKLVTQLNELEFIEGEIWANVWQTWQIVRISPQSGEVLGHIDLRGVVAREDHNKNEDFLNGIAYDPATKAIYVTGKKYSYIYQIELVKPS